MFTAHFTGTRKEIKRKLKALDIPGIQHAPEAVRAFVMGHIPMLLTCKWQVAVSCESINNPSLETMAGHMTVIVQQIKP